MLVEFTPLQPGQRRIGRYGWHPDLPDHRDLHYAVPHAVALALPASADLRPGCPPVYDQGQLGSCTANAIAGAIEFDQIKEKLPEFTPFRLFIYYNERVIEHDVQSDNGAQIRDGIKSVLTSQQLFHVFGTPCRYLTPRSNSKLSFAFRQQLRPHCGLRRRVSFSDVARALDADT